MKYANLTHRIVNLSPEDGQLVDPWVVHTLAVKRVSEGEDITMLSIGQEVHESTPDVIVNAAVASLQAGRHHYEDVRGEQKLREAIVKYHGRMTGQHVSADQITVFAGAQNALFGIAQVLLETGDDVLLVAPYYTTYKATFGASGANVITVQVEAADGYQLDVQALLDAITDKTRVIVLNAPNNPLGSRYSQQQLAKILAACVTSDIWLVLDSVYLDIVDSDSIALPHAMPGADKLLITIGSLSKSHRMTGWRIGWAVGPASLAQHLSNLSVCMHYGLPPFIQDAARVAIEQSAETPRTVQQVMKERRAIALDTLVQLDPVRIIDAGEGMFVLLDVQPLSLSASEFAFALLDKYAVSVLPCDGFGPGGHYLIRIGLCVDGDALRAACEKICHFVHEQR